MEAWFVMSSTLRPTAAPIATSESRLVLRPMAFAFAPMLFSALTFTAPVEMTVGLVVPLPIEARVVWRAQFTETAAAMFTPPLSWPDSLFDFVLAESV